MNPLMGFTEMWKIIEGLDLHYIAHHDEGGLEIRELRKHSALNLPYSTDFQWCVLESTQLDEYIEAVTTMEKEAEKTTVSTTTRTGITIRVMH